MAILPAMLAILGAIAGCSSEPAVIPAPAQAGLPFPDTPDRLMANFRTIYETKDYDAFREMLSPDFATFLQLGTISRYPDVGATLELPEEQRIHQRMFAGNTVTDPAGAVVPAVVGIDFEVFEPLGAWAQSPVNDQVPDCQWRMYEVAILLDRGAYESALTVHGQIKFYVTHRDSTVNGVTKPYYRMRGQMDLTFDEKHLSLEGKGVESTAWGTVKALFR